MHKEKKQFNPIDGSDSNGHFPNATESPLNKAEVRVDIILGDITDPQVVGKNTAIVIPGNSYFFSDTHYQQGVQAALARKAAPELMMAARNSVVELYGANTRYANGTTVLIDTDKVVSHTDSKKSTPQKPDWRERVPRNILFAVTMEPDPETGHRVDKESIVTTIREVLLNAEIHGISEIAFPMIGTGLMGLSIEDFFQGFKQGLLEYTKLSQQKTLQDIKLVIYPGSISLPAGLQTVFTLPYPIQPDLDQD